MDEKTKEDIEKESWLEFLAKLRKEKEEEIKEAENGD